MQGQGVLGRDHGHPEAMTQTLAGGLLAADACAIHDALDQPIGRGSTDGPQGRIEALATLLFGPDIKGLRPLFTCDPFSRAAQAQPFSSPPR